MLYRQPAETRRANWDESKQLLKNQIFPARVEQKQRVNPEPPVRFQIASLFWLSQAVYVAAKLGIADLLADEPQSCDKLASISGVDEGSLWRLMRALSGTGVFKRLDDGRFALGPVGEGLRTAVPGSLRETVTTLGEIHYLACGELLYGVQTGCPAFHRVFGTPLFGYLEQNPEASDSFNRGMSNLSAMLAYALLVAYDFANVSWIVDVGGGEGKLLQKILQFYPELDGVVFDSARTIVLGHRSSAIP